MAATQVRMTEIYKLKDEYVDLHEKYRADPLYSGSTAVLLSGMSDRMLEILLKIVMIIEDDGQGSVREAVQTGSQGAEHRNHDLRSRSKMSLNWCDVYKRERLSEEKETEDAHRHDPKLKCIKVEPLCDTDQHSKHGEESDGSFSDSMESDASYAGSSSEEDSTSDAEEEELVTEKVRKLSTVAHLKESPNDREFKKPQVPPIKIVLPNRLKQQFKELTSDWVNEGEDAHLMSARQGLKKKHLTTDEKRDLFDFYTKHIAEYGNKIVSERIQDKYGIAASSLKQIIRKAKLEGEQALERSKGSGRRPISFEERGQAYADVLKWALSNPKTATYKDIAARLGIKQTTASLIFKPELQKHGVKIFNQIERRAARLKESGKEYTPYHETPEQAEYQRVQSKDRKKRLQNGDLRDGRIARHKDTTWKSLKEVAGVPEDQTCYVKSNRKSRRKSRPSDDEEGPSKKKTPSKGSSKTSLTASDAHLSQSSSQRNGHNHSHNKHTNWSLHVDLETGFLYDSTEPYHGDDQSTRSSLYSPRPWFGFSTSHYLDSYSNHF